MQTELLSAHARAGVAQGDDVRDDSYLRVGNVVVRILQIGVVEGVEDIPGEKETESFGELDVLVQSPVGIK